MSGSNRPLAENEAALLAGNIKATREDWLNVALDVLVSEGVEQVKVLGLAERLSVSRSSFYWYFKSRQHLLDELLEVWEQTNTGAILAQAEAPAETITEAVCNLFRCFVDIDLYNHQLDFAVREWARRSGHVRGVIDSSDARRVTAIRLMFKRHGYPEQEAEVRARVLYFMQIGYYTLEIHEPLEERLGFVPEYLHAFTGRAPRPEEIAAFEAYALGVRDRRKR